MLKIRLGFLKVLDRKMPGCRTEAQAIKLRKDEPHPVGSLLSRLEFRNYMLVYVFLYLNETA
jgi:hypothetical protein